MTNEQTAVEWLAEKIRFTNKELYAELQDEIKKAKTMEIDLRSDSYQEGYDNGCRDSDDEW